MASIRAKIYRADGMTCDMDSGKAAELIECMRLARIGDDRKWNRLVKKVRCGGALNANEIGYLVRFSKIYGESRVTARSKILHTRLSEEDEKPQCAVCGQESEFYCNQNDAYFCSIHIVGHDENER